MKPKLTCRETLVSDSGVRRIMACHTYILIFLFLCSSIFFPHVAAAQQEQESKKWMKTAEAICGIVNDYGQLLDMLLSWFGGTEQKGIKQLLSFF